MHTIYIYDRKRCLLNSILPSVYTETTQTQMHFIVNTLAYINFLELIEILYQCVYVHVLAIS